jgi:hypothetical protein
MATLPDVEMPEHDLSTEPQDAVVPKAPSRRRFFAMGAGALASMAGATVVEAQISRTRGKPVAPALPAGAGKPDPSVDWKDPVVRLVRRVTMGLEASEVAFARQRGFAGYLDWQLNDAAIDDSVLDGVVSTRYPLLAGNWAALRAADGGELYNQLADMTLHRAAFSRKQLKERMVEFWTDHFNILHDKVQYAIVADNRDVIRQHALGKFPDMLRASSKSAAMLWYLDQNTSRADGGRTPNQNYAREIMELHTIGVDGGYTQNDVAQLSRILTGWSFNGNTGIFNFVASWHDRTAKTFMGVNYPAMAANTPAVQQLAEGEQAVNQLLNNPQTPLYISTKMARWLLAYTPPQSVIDATVATYNATGGDIKAMIRTILTAANLMAAPAKYKRPFHLVASALRGMNAEVVNIRPARQRLDILDMTPFYWEQPDGYPDRTNWWSGLAIQRWNWGNYIATRNSATDARVNVATMFQAPTNTADGVIQQINVRMFGGEMPSTLRTSLRSYLTGGTYNDARIRETLALAANSHQFQWY